jgi:hypothetical protein
MKKSVLVVMCALGAMVLLIAAFTVFLRLAA